MTMTLVRPKIESQFYDKTAIHLVVHCSLLKPTMFIHYTTPLLNIFSFIQIINLIESK